MSKFIRSAALSLVLVCLAWAILGAGAAAAKTSLAQVQRGLEGLTAAPGGPPGAIATLYRDGKLTTISVGRAEIGRPGVPRATEYMRIASVAKAYSGAVVLNLVGAGKLRLEQTLGELLRGMPADWSEVTVAQMLAHTSGVPDYTDSKAFMKHAQTDPRGHVSPLKVVSWVRDEPLEFEPGTKYRYSNTDNILVGLIAQALTGERYGELLKRIVFQPAGLHQTSFPSSPWLPNPLIHGYLIAPGEEPNDVSTALSSAGAWASGAIVSTPRDMNAFIRADLGLKFFDAAQQREQMQFWPGGESSPPGPGKNSAGLALFRYQTRCGTVYGHTGNFPGYVQFAAATADGSRAVTTTLNIPAPKGHLLAQLRSVQTAAVCALLGK